MPPLSSREQTVASPVEHTANQNGRWRLKHTCHNIVNSRKRLVSCEFYASWHVGARLFVAAEFSKFVTIAFARD